MFQVKVDKQTPSYRCQKAGKVSNGPAVVEYVETSLLTMQAEVQLFSLFSRIFNAAIHRSKG